MKSVKPLLISFTSTLVFAGIVLISAGRLSYWPAWEYAALGVTSNLATRWVLLDNPELERERTSGPRRDAKAWDKRLMGLGLLLTLGMLIVGGLDAGRFHWSPHAPWAVSIFGLAVGALGSGIFLRAMRANRYFSAVVRIQEDRGQAVCTSGPYRLVRHPGYVGMIVGTVGLPFLFMSIWSAIPALLFVVLMVVRTHLEDATLARELGGYRDYQRSTPYRLIPCVW